MPFDVILAGALGVSILLFALAGGADFGGGFWSLFARRGERATEQQQLIERSIGPLWEANELWVVVSAVILWSAFSPAFSAYGTALFIPFVLAIAGILLRGAFLAFRIEAQEEAPGAYRFFGEIFGSMSIITPFFLGAAAGAIASGRLRLDENELPVDGYFQPWLGPFPIIVGLLGVATCVYLAAIYLTCALPRGTVPAQLLRFGRGGVRPLLEREQVELVARGPDLRRGVGRGPGESR